MLPIVKFGLEKIHANPHQDKQYSFKMVRVTKPLYPVKRDTQLYQVKKHLPNNQDFFHVYVLGNISPKILNLLKQNKNWYRDSWVNVEEDMNERNYVLQVYNDLGVIYPRSDIYYSFIDEGSIAICLRVTPTNKRLIDVESMRFIRVYSNDYFRTPEFKSSSNPVGIYCIKTFVETNIHKVNLQILANTLKADGGEVLLYVNGFYTSNINLHIPDFSIVELLYDRSIVSKEKVSISELRTFTSIMDNKLKYLVFRDKSKDYLQYQDDVDFYVTTNNELFNKGVFFYKHKDLAVRNVTDKDYAIYTDYINNQAAYLSEKEGGAVQDKNIELIVRRSGVDKPLIYSSLKLHELYKLPQEVEKNVLSNNGYTVTELRAEHLENSDYFKLVAACSLKYITNELCTSAVGYSSIKYYFANTPTNSITENNIDVPELYQQPSYAYEYNSEGKLINRNETIGPMYTRSSSLVKSVEFIKGRTPSNYDRLYNHNDTIVLRDSEYVIMSAFFENSTRISSWEDISNNTDIISIENNIVTLNEINGKKVKIIYLDQPLTYDLNIRVVDGVLFFPLTINEDRGLGVFSYHLDLPFTSLDIFLNGYRLDYKIGYNLSFPYVNICDKTHIDYTKEEQHIHIRVHGLPTTKELVNSKHITGYVSHGVLTRNNLYDIRDDRVFSVYIKGRLQNRNNILFAEEDNTLRVNSDINGLPYSLVEHELSTKEITGVSTLPIYEKNSLLNEKISDLYNLVYKEPDIDKFNVIGDHYYLFSPTVSKVIHDMLDNNIHPRVYTTPYNDSTILNLLEEKYKYILATDPIKINHPNNLIEIHPHYGNTTIEVNLHQYRFITNLIRIITGNKPERISISGYLSITTTNDETATSNGFIPSGITVL